VGVHKDGSGLEGCKREEYKGVKKNWVVFAESNSFTWTKRDPFIGAEKG